MTAALEAADVETSWIAYLRAVMGDHSTQADISARTGLNPATVSRWFTGGMPWPMTAVAVARAYGLNPLEALMAAGYLTPAEVELPSVDPRRLSTPALLDEIAHRSKIA